MVFRSFPRRNWHPGDGTQFCRHLVVSRLTPASPAEIQEMVEVLRTPRDEPPAPVEVGEEQLD